MADTLLEEQADQPVDVKYDEYIPGEGKKFKDIETLARSKAESDSYIEIMKRRQDQLREDYLALKADYDARAKLEDLLDQIEKRPPTQSSNEQPTVKEEVRPVKPDRQEMKSLVDDLMKEHEVLTKADNNFKMVKDKLVERYGNNYQSALKTYMDDLGLTQEAIDGMARTTPKALIKALGLDQPQQSETFQSPPRSTQRRDNFRPTGAKKKTWSYYQEMKQKNPNIYFDPKIAVEMEKSAQELGDEFMDGDFHKFG